MKNKKILFMLVNMNLGGTEKAVLSMLSSLPKDFEAELLFLGKSGNLLNIIPDDVKYSEIPNSEMVAEFIKVGCRQFAFNELIRGNLLSFLKNLLVLLLFKVKIINHTFYGIEKYTKNDKTKQFDFAIAYAGPHDFISYYILNKVNARKKVQWIHFDIEKVITNFNFGKKYYPFYDKIVCVSKSAKDIFLKCFPELENKTEVFHNIISEIELKKQSAVGATYEDCYDGIRILTVGRFTKEKGQHLIPAVAEKLKAVNIRFRWYLVGNGKEKATVEQLAFDLGVENDLVFLGEKENPYRYMQDCNIYVQPSLHEGYGITVAEVKIFNKPIVVTDFASAKDLITNNKTGVICEISTEGIYSAVKSLLLNPDLQRRFSENLLNTAKTAKNDFAKLLN